MTAQRGNWGSRFGFVMAAAGSAVGLGNIWKFPYMAGQNGGSAFLVIYLAFVLGFGLALVIAELVMGRMTERNPVGAFRRLAGGAWPLAGGMGITTAFIILSFYTVVAGWTIAYLMYAINGSLATTDTSHLNALFGQLVGSGMTPLIYAAVFMVMTSVVVAAGIGRGIERASKLFMPLLFIVLVLLVLRSVTLPGAGAGLAFFLKPDFSHVSIHTFSAALGQAFFSLSLGVGGLITYGSYMSREQKLGRDALNVVLLDTIVAVLAGLMVIPAIFAAGLTPDAGGPGTTFKVLPAVFAAMPGGHWFAIGFFLLLVLASLTSSVSLMEPVISYLVDEHRMPRPLAVTLTAIACFALAVPVSLSFGAWSGVSIAGYSIFGFLDFLTGSLLLPLGSLFIALCVGWVLGPHAVTALSDDERGAPRWGPLWLFILRFVAPIGIGWILVNELYG